MQVGDNGVKVLLIIAAGILFAAEERSFIRLVDVADSLGITALNRYGGTQRKDFIHETTGNGALIFDYNGDGRNDLLLLNGPTGLPSLYTGKPFIDRAAAAGLTQKAWTQAACSGDIDNDGHPDLLITSYGVNRLYRNNGKGGFVDVTAAKGLPTAGTRFGSGCTFLDYDRDGRLDLFIANYVTLDLAKTPKPGSADNCVWKEIPVMCGPQGLPLASNILYRQEPNGVFRDVSRQAGILAPGGRYGLQAVAADFDDDGWPDIYVACDMTASLLYRNRGDGTFEERGSEAGVAYNFDGRLQAGMGVAVGDYDNDGRLDIAKTNFSGDLTSLFRNEDGRFFTDVSRQAGLGVRQLLGWGIAWFDADDDGWRDLLLVNGHVYPEVEGSNVGDRYLQETLLFHNQGVDRQGRARFRDISREAGEGLAMPRPSRGLAIGDLDGDGRPEAVILNMNAKPTVLKNTAPGGRFLNLLLEGTKSNRSAIGARVTVEAGDRKWTEERMSGASYYSQHAPELHFGLGTAFRVDRVNVRWPSGLKQEWTNLPVGALCRLTEASPQARCEPYGAAGALGEAPEFAPPGGFIASRVDAAIDGTSHASGQRVQAAKTLAHTLDAWLKEPPASPGEQNVAEQAAFARGFALFEQGRFADAAAAFAFVPPSARLRIARGVALFAQGGYAEAAALFAQAAAMTAAPDARILPYLEQTGEFEPVARQIERFARMLPRNGRAQYAHGLILAPKDPQRAAPLFRLAAQLDPADPRPLLELAKLAATPTEAIPLLEAVIRIDPKQEQAHYRLGLLFQQQGDATKANQHFTEFRRLKSASTPAPPLGAPPR